MKPAQIEKLSRICDLVGQRLRARVAPAIILAELVADHGATHDKRREPARLRAAGVTSTCTAGDFGLLTNWRTAATLRLMKANMERDAA